MLACSSCCSGKRERSRSHPQCGHCKNPGGSCEETEREEKRQARNQADAVKIVGQMRTMITKHFGDVAQIKFSKVKFDVDPDSPSEAPVYEDLDIHLVVADGAHLKINVEKAIQIEGVWKFRENWMMIWSLICWIRAESSVRRPLRERNLSIGDQCRVQLLFLGMRSRYLSESRYSSRSAASSGEVLQEAFGHHREGGGGGLGDPRGGDLFM